MKNYISKEIKEIIDINKAKEKNLIEKKDLLINTKSDYSKYTKELKIKVKNDEDITEIHRNYIKAEMKINILEEEILELEKENSIQTDEELREIDTIIRDSFKDPIDKLAEKHLEIHIKRELLLKEEENLFQEDFILSDKYTDIAALLKVNKGIYYNSQYVGLGLTDATYIKIGEYEIKQDEENKGVEINDKNWEKC